MNVYQSTSNIMRKTPENIPCVIDAEALHDQMEREIAEEEWRYQRLSKGVIELDSGGLEVIEDLEGLRWLDKMKNAALSITAKDEAPFKIGSIISGSGRYSGAFYRLTPMGKTVWELCREAIPLIEGMFPGCRRKGRDAFQAVDPYEPPNGAQDGLKAQLSPYITVMLRACQRATQALWWHGGGNLEVDNPRVRAVIERLVRFVRRVCRTRRFRRIENNHRRSERKNRVSCCRYMAAVFAEYSKQLIVRVDLYIPHRHKEWGESKEAASCIRRYLRAVREDRIVPDVRAWICKRERGPRRGIHFHLLVALDGHKHEKARIYAQRLGEAWEKRFSGGRGTYFNCWTRRRDYPYNCLGLVRLNDWRMLRGLYEAIKYMTKNDCHVETGYDRNLWRGITCASSKVPKRGAPRRANHDLSVVTEILMGEGLL